MPGKQIRLKGAARWRLAPREQGEERWGLESSRQSAFRLGHNSRLKNEPRGGDAIGKLGG